MADDDLARLTRAYAQLLSLAVHEFRTPVSVVGGYLRMLQRDTESPLPDRHRKMVEEAEKSCARLVALIGELSEVSKIDSSELTLQQAPFDILTVVRNAAGESHEAEDRGVRMVARGPASGAMLTGDQARLQRAIGVLFKAVLREQPGDGVVVAEARLVDANGRRAVVVAAAPEGQIDTIFDAAQLPLDEKRGGLGLELPIARRIIERHGGRIWCPPSDKDGVGAKGAIVMEIGVTT